MPTSPRITTSGGGPNRSPLPRRRRRASVGAVAERESSSPNMSDFLEEITQRIEPLRQQTPQDTPAIWPRVSTRNLPRPSAAGNFQPPLVNIKLEEFYGECSEDVQDFIDSLEDEAENNLWDDSTTLQVAVSNLRGNARRWYRVHRRPGQTWRDLRCKLIRDFGISATSYDFEEELNSRTLRKDESMLRYTEEVLFLCKKVDPVMSASTKLLYLISGLTDEMPFVALTQNINSVEAFLTYSKKVDEIKAFQYKRGLKTRRSNPEAYRPNTFSKPRQPYQQQRIVTEENNYRRNNYEHVPQERYKNNFQQKNPSYNYQRNQPQHQAERPLRREPPQRRNVQLEKRKTDTWRTNDNLPICFRCNQPGHVSRYCRNEENQPRRPFNRIRTLRLNEPANSETDSTYEADPTPLTNLAETDEPKMNSRRLYSEVCSRQVTPDYVNYQGHSENF